MPVKTYNKIEVVGRLGADVVVTTIPKKSIQVFSFPIGSDKPRVGKRDVNAKGEPLKADWLQVVCYNSQVASLNLRKGSLVKVEGHIDVKVWSDPKVKKDGKPLVRQDVKVVADSVRPVVEERTEFSPISSGSLKLPGSLAEV